MVIAVVHYGHGRIRRMGEEVCMQQFATWWKEGVVYQIYPRSFQDSNDDGVGDIPGIIRRLDYLQWLGVSAIWLSPIYPSPMRDFGYDVSDYRGVDPLFGSLTDMDELIAKAHERGLKVILDMVLNHTSNEHAWFRESSSSRDNPKSDFYIWKDKVPGNHKGLPNNWYACFGGRAWTFEPKRGQYYLHSFLAQQPDLNWRNDAVVEALFNDMRFWLEKGVDGFRLDVINAIVKDDMFRDNPGCVGPTPRPYDMQRHLFDRNRPEAHGKLRRFRKMMDEYDDRMLVGEIMVEAPGEPEKAASYLGGGDNELHLAFDFTLLSTKWGAGEWRRVAQRWYKAMPVAGWPCWVLSNHDMPRAISRFKGSLPKAKLAAMFLLTQRGTPFIYYGEEIGMTDIRLPRSKFQDPLGKKYWPFHPGRDPERSPMQWDSSLNAGFSAVRPWLPLCPDHSTKNVEVQKNEPDSMLSYYRALLQLRNHDEVLRLGSHRFLETTSNDVMAYVREYRGMQRLVLLNFSGKALAVAPRSDGRNPDVELAGGRALFSTEGTDGSLNQLDDGRILLCAYQGLICSIV